MTSIKITFKDGTHLDITVDDETVSDLMERFDPSRVRYYRNKDAQIFLATNEVRSISRISNTTD